MEKYLLPEPTSLWPSADELPPVLVDDENVLIGMLMPVKSLHAHVKVLFGNTVNFRIGPDSSNRKYL